DGERIGEYGVFPPGSFVWILIEKQSCHPLLLESRKAILVFGPNPVQSEVGYTDQSQLQ
ncbi:hypothetical protein P7K49_006243, partial [Saguinus oedipus]